MPPGIGYPIDPALIALAQANLRGQAPAPAPAPPVIDLDQYELEQARLAQQQPGYIELDAPHRPAATPVPRSERAPSPADPLGRKSVLENVQVSPTPQFRRESLLQGSAAPPATSEPAGPPAPPGVGAPGTPGQMQLDPSLSGIAPRPRYIPGGYRKLRSLEQGAVDMYGRGLTRAERAIGAETDAVQARNAMLASEYRLIEEENNRTVGELMAGEQARRDRVAEQHSLIRKRSDEVASQMGSFDTKRLFRNMDTGTKLMHLVGAALGGALAGLQGGPNQFIEGVDKAIQMDIAEQNAALDGKRQLLTTAERELGALREEHGDRRIADLAKHDMSLAGLAARINAVTAEATNPILKAQAEKLKAAIDERRGALLEHLDSRIFVPPRMVGAAKVEPARLVYLPGGGVRAAPDAARAQKAQGLMTYYHTLSKLDDEALKTRNAARDAVAKKDLTSLKVAQTRLNELQNERLNTISGAVEQGVVTKSDADRDTKSGIDYSGVDIFTDKATDKSIAQSRDHWKQRGQETIDLYAPHVMDESYGVTPQGTVGPQQRFTGETESPTPGGKPKGFVAK